MCSDSLHLRSTSFRASWSVDIFSVYPMSLCVDSWTEINISASLLGLLCTLHRRRALNIDTQTLHFVPFFHGAAAPVGQGHLIIEASRSHSGTPHSIGLLWRRDQPVTQTSTWQHTTFTTDRHPCPTVGFELANLSNERPPGSASFCGITTSPRD